ncbi:MAG: serine hydrolase, partial [Planctomycetales bacterium]|nr:serine hydrolase [Planctomycetales bacterium]
MTRKATCCVLVIQLSLATLSRADEPTNEWRTAIDRLFANITEIDPGCALGVVRNGQVVLKRGYGRVNAAYDRPIDSSTIFEIASGSKTFTSACIAILADLGKLDLDDDIHKYLPELQLNQAVKLRHVLRCETGIWAQFHIMPLAGYDNVPVHAPYSKDDVFTILCGQKQLPFEPGTEFQYGSGDTFLLGIVVERVSGQTLAEFAKQNLFRPLGMNRTGYLEDPTRIVENRATGHWKSPTQWSSGDHIPVLVWHSWNTNA